MIQLTLKDLGYSIRRRGNHSKIALFYKSFNGQTVTILLNLISKKYRVRLSWEEDDLLYIESTKLNDYEKSALKKMIQAEEFVGYPNMTHLEYLELVKQLNKYNDYYYKHNNPLVPDSTFDKLMKDVEKYELENPELIANDSPTKKPGSDLTNSKTLRHGRPMLSLENTFSFEEVETWFNKMKTYGATTFIVEAKYDGASFAARYENGKLVQGLSRGDGAVGEDLTNNLKLIKDLNDGISKGFTGEIRGEILMTKSEFKRINSLGGNYANPRNLAAGTLKLLDKAEFQKRTLISQVYWLEDAKGSHYQSLLDLKSKGFNINKELTFKCNTYKEVEEAITKIESLKDSIDIELDGAVIKVDNISLRDTIGGTSKFPHWAKAFKYQQKSVETTIESITIQIGRTGKITPVAELTPVFIDGSTVSRVTLNNFEYIEERDIRIGDVVSVIKSAAIIPMIVDVIISKRNSNITKYIKPDKCPICQTPLVKLNEDHMDIFCTNTQCSARIVDKINYYVKSLEIDGLAETTIERLYEGGLLNSISDIYKLEEAEVYNKAITLERISKTILDKIIKNINSSKSQPLHKYLAGFGISNIGLSTSKLITSKYKTIDAIIGLDDSSIQSISGLGKVASENIISFFKDINNLKMISYLKEKGISLIEPDETVGDKLNGKTIVITGSLEKPRKHYEELILKYGGKNSSSVSNSTTYLITNEPNSSSSKIKKARELNIPIKSEKELMDILTDL